MATTLSPAAKQTTGGDYIDLVNCPDSPRWQPAAIPSAEVRAAPAAVTYAQHVDVGAEW